MASNSSHGNGPSDHTRMGTGLKRPFAKRSAALHVWLEKCLYDTYDTSFMDHLWIIVHVLMMIILIRELLEGT